MALTFRNLKQITIEESLGVGKTRSIARFPCDSMAFVLHALLFCVQRHLHSVVIVYILLALESRICICDSDLVDLEHFGTFVSCWIHVLKRRAIELEPLPGEL